MRHNDLEIQTVAPDGSGLRPLTRNDNDDLQPSWAPDGTRLAFVRVVRGRPVRTDIWVMNADGSGERVLVRNGIEPSWTADGARIVFTRHGTGPSSSYAAEVSTGREQLLVAGGYHGTPSPDGTKLAFVRGSLGSSRVVVAAADGSGRPPWARRWAAQLVARQRDPGVQRLRARQRVHGPGGRERPDAPSDRRALAALLLVLAGRGYVHVQLRHRLPGESHRGDRVDGSGRRVVTAARGRSRDPAWQPLRADPAGVERGRQ